MGGACNTYGGEKAVQQGFGRKTREKRVKERDNFEVRNLDGMIILIWIFIHCVACLKKCP